MPQPAPDTRHLPALDGLPCALLVVDPQGLVVWANRTLEQWLGRSPADGNTRLADLLADGSLAVHHTRKPPACTGANPLEEIGLELKTATGQTIPVLATATARGEAEGSLVDWVFLPDRTRPLYERELSESHDEMRVLVHEATRLEAEAQDRALFAEQMVGIVSHDLRNPLQAIHMGVLALTRGSLTTNQIRVLGRVSRSTERAHRLIADLLDFTAARMGSGLAISKQEIDLANAVGEAVEELGLAFPGRELVHRLAENGSFAIDPDRLAQLVGNLVANAMAYGDPSRPVTVDSVISDGMARVAVHNWGQHIPADRLESIFQPMVRGDSRGQSRSVGLGLYIVGEIVKSHGGTIAVTSSPENGTTFTASFPSQG